LNGTVHLSGRVRELITNLGPTASAHFGIHKIHDTGAQTGGPDPYKASSNIHDLLLGFVEHYLVFKLELACIFSRRRFPGVLNAALGVVTACRCGDFYEGDSRE